MSGKSSPLKCLIIGINAWVKLPEGENILTPATDFMQVTLLIDYMERVSCEFLRWVEAEMVSPEVENEKWRRLLLDWMYDAFDVSADDRKEDFFPEMKCGGSIVVSVHDVVKD
ncbi:hypothetical protein Tco_0050023 [Tanacetum coccineum]